MTAVTADLADRDSLARALEGCESAFFVTPHDPAEERLGFNFIETAEALGVRRLVFASALHADFSSALTFRIFVAVAGALTHYGPKLRVEQRVRQSTASPVVLMPSNFFQNDELFEQELAAGSYPQPLGLKGVNRVDCRDIADAAARALVDPAVAAGAWPLVGPEPALTGPGCAAVWASALGRPVTYDGSLDRWSALVSTRMHARERDDFRQTYRLFGRLRIAASPAALQRTTALLGRPPRAYSAYVAERAGLLLRGNPSGSAF
jgi:uncharacterized protein YbjT (DUF2867 family)